MNSIQLHSVVEFVRNGATIKQDKNSSLGIPITRIETISNSVFNYDRLGYANVQDDTYSKYYLYDNDVLLSHINSEKFLGRSVLYKLDPAITPIIHGMNLLCIRFHKQVYNPAFFVWYTKSDIAKDYFKIHTKRAVNQASITSTAIKEMPIPDIKIEMQNAIVCELDKIQEALANKNEQLKKLDELIQSKFYEMFGDPIINEKGWEMKVLEKMGKIASGGTPSRNKSEYFLGNINWYSAGELNTLYLPDSIEHITEKALLESSAKLFPKGSLMIGMYDTAAFKLGILKKDSASNQACANIELYEDCVVWLYYTLKLMREEALRHRHGARQKNLNVTFIKSFSVPHPPLPLQKTFANFVEKVEEAKVIVNQEIAHLQELLDSRMDFYFRK